MREADPWAVMAAYNSVNGHTMTESPMLAEILKGEWGWDGLVMSDWFATRDAVGAGNAAHGPRDARPGEPVRRRAGRRRPRRPRARGRARREDRVDPAPVRARRDRARPPPGTTTPSPASCAPARRPRSCSRATRATCSRSRPATLERVAVLGPNAAVARTLGGGSATVFPPYTVSPLDGLRAALGDVEVTHSPGVRAHERIPLVRPEQLVSLETPAARRRRHGARGRGAPRRRAGLAGHAARRRAQRWRSTRASAPTRPAST